MVAVDTESTGLSIYDKADRGTGFSIAMKTKDGAIAEYFPVDHIDKENNMPQEAFAAMMNVLMEKTLLLHFAIHDITQFNNWGYQVKRFICTARFDHLLNENYKNYSLDEVTLRRIGFKGKDRPLLFQLALQAYGWDMPSGPMHAYAMNDADILIPTFEAQLAQMKKQGEGDKLINYWKTIEAPSIIGLAKMRQRGVSVVLDTCREEEEKGMAAIKGVQDWFGFNPGSGTELKRLLIDELGLPVVKRGKVSEKMLEKDPEAVGNPSFDKKAMEIYDVLLQEKAETINDNHTREIVEQLLTFRGWSKAVTSYYRPYQARVSFDGRIRPEYKPHGTVTGRFSCAEPNLQQIPKESDKVWNGRIKECLTGDDGYILWEVDYSQLEFRLAASASNETRLLEVFADPDRDIFTEMAADLGMPRQQAKGLTYSIQYGAGVPRIMSIFGVSADEAKQIIDNFYETYPNLKKESQRRALQGKAGSVPIWSGRRRHFQNASKEYFKSFNSYVQGGAADIVKMVMNDVFTEVDNEQECRLLLQVHDSLVFEIEKGKEGLYLPRIEEVMTRPSKQFGVNLAVDSHLWSKREEMLYAA